MVEAVDQMSFAQLVREFSELIDEWKEGAGSSDSTATIYAKDHGWTSYPTRAQAAAGANMQPLLQQLVDLARSLGIGRVELPRGYYSFWTPLRTYHNDNVAADQSGIPLIVRGRLELAGPSAGCATLVRRTWLGLDPAIYANTQMLPENQADAGIAGGGGGNGQPMPWRGGFAILVGLPITGAAPADYGDRPSLTLSGNLDIDGGLPISPLGRTTQPLLLSISPGQSGALPPWYELQTTTGYGWDITDKGITATMLTWTGDIRITGNVRFGGYRGELLYWGGGGGGSLYQYGGKLYLHDTDGDALNPGPEGAEFGPPTVQLDDTHIEDCLNIYEGWTGEGGWVNIYAKNCFGGTIQGGRPNTFDSTFNYYKPTRFSGGSLPECKLNITLVNQIGSFVPGSWCVGEITSIDGNVYIEGTQYSYDGGVIGQRLTVNLIADSKDNISLSIAAYGVPGKKYFTNCRYKVNCYRTELAIANNRAVASPVSWIGSFGPDIWFEGGEGECKRLPSITGNIIQTPDHQLNFRNNSWRQIPLADGSVDNAGIYYSPDVAFTPAYPETSAFTELRYTGPVLKVVAGSHPVVLALPEANPWLEGGGTSRLGTGAQWTIINDGSGPLVIPPANGGGGQRTLHTIYIPPQDKMTFEFDGYYWQAMTPSESLRSGNYNYTAGTVAAAASSATFSIPLLGCTLLSNVSVATNAGLVPGVDAVAVAGVNEVLFHIENRTTSPWIGNPAIAIATAEPGWDVVTRPSAPGVPTITAATVGGTVEVSVTAPSSTGGPPVVGYRISRNGAFYAYFLKSGTSPKFVDGSPVSGAVYRAAAVNGAQILGPLSDPATAGGG